MGGVPLSFVVSTTLSSVARGTPCLNWEGLLVILSPQALHNLHHFVAGHQRVLLAQVLSKTAGTALLTMHVYVSAGTQAGNLPKCRTRQDHLCPVFRMPLIKLG